MAQTLVAHEQPIQKIFSDDYVFSIPDYQRPYAWTPDEARELIDDLLGFIEVNPGPVSEMPSYFLGSIVLIKGDSPVADVVDGQQRLTTLTLLLAAIRANVGVKLSSKITKRLYEEGDELATIRCIQKPGKPEADQGNLVFAKNNADVFQALRGRCDVAAGTAWLWSRAEALESVDVLFVDEAAQVSLANVLAVSHAAPSLVLLGDPRQLDQPTQGSHPEGTGVSALDYILNGRLTIGPEQGLFLGETWRLHPDICAFTSELFYESRLTAIPGLELQEARSAGRVRGSGLRYVPVVHEGNQNSSPEEAEAIGKLVAEILGTGTTWVDRHGVEQPVSLEDILIIAPLVFDLNDKIPGGRIGVDKFQGQEAPIVIYSMTTSTHADAPRDMNFVYSLNGLNGYVACAGVECFGVFAGVV